MKICIITHTFPRFNGDTAAPFMGELANGLVDNGHKVVVLTPYDEKIVKEKRKFDLVTYKYIWPESLATLGYSRTLQGDKNLRFSTYLIAPFMYLFGFFSLLKLVRREKVEVISAHWIVPNGFITALVSLVSGIPFTVTIPGSDVYMGSKNMFFKYLIGFAAWRANYVISDSSHYLQQLNDLGFYPQNTEVIRYGVNEKKFVQMKKSPSLLKQLNINPADKIVMGVGRFVEKKGFKYLISAMPDILDKQKNAKLVLVGDGSQRQELEELAKKLKVNNSVIFPGMIDYSTLVSYYNLADIFVMPSVRDDKGNIDASPVAMMEAMICGTPVVATKFSGSTELVIKGVTGHLVSEKSSSDIAKAVIEFFKKDTNSRSKVREMAIKNFSIGETSHRYSKIFAEVTKK
jgi:glycosyltransferase involved in cell wall biosynthesis